MSEDDTVKIMKAVGVLLEDDYMTFIEAYDPIARGLIMFTFEDIARHQDRISSIVEMINRSGMYGEWPIHIFHSKGILAIKANGKPVDD